MIFSPLSYRSERELVVVSTGRSTVPLTTVKCVLKNEKILECKRMLIKEVRADPLQTYRFLRFRENYECSIVTK